MIEKDGRQSYRGPPRSRAAGKRTPLEARPTGAANVATVGSRAWTLIVEKDWHLFLIDKTLNTSNAPITTHPFSSQISINS